MEEIYDRLLSDIEKKSDTYCEDYLKIKQGVDNSTAIYHGEPVPFIYQPLLFSNEDWDKLEFVLQMLNRILKKVTARYLIDKNFREYFRFPQLMEELILIDPGYEIEYPVARFDLFYDYSDNYKFCELNTDGSSAMNEARVLQQEFRGSKLLDFLSREVEKAYDLKGEPPLIDSELFYSLIDKILENYRTYFKNIKGETPPQKDELTPNVGIMDFQGDGTVKEFEEFKKRFEKMGCKTVICDPRELVYKNDKLYSGELPLDLIYRRATTARMVEEGKEIEDFLDAYRAQDICVVGSFRSQIPHNKIIFAILHNQEAVDFLEDEEYQFIEKHIPWTTIYNPDDSCLKDRLVRNKDEYILKPRDMFAGKGVYVGQDFSQEEWFSILEDIEGSNYDYLVQEFVDVPHRPMPIYENGELIIDEFNYIVGLFQYNQELQGLYARGGRKNVIAAAGESFTLPVYVVND